MVDKVKENYYRRMAKRLGLMLRKSSATKLSVTNRGGYRIVEAVTGKVRAGEWWELSFKEAADHLDREEAFFKVVVDSGIKYGKKEGEK